jgi:glycosyltransferase involved in cell wall biosynthesis
MVFEVRDLWPELPIAVGALKNPLLVRLARLLEKTSYQHSARVVALSPGMAQGVANAGFPSKHITIIPNCCDVDLFRVDASAGEEFLRAHPYLRGGDLVTYCGTLGMINGVDYLVRIAAEMRSRNPKIRFVIMGGGARQEAIVAEAQRCGVWQTNLWLLPQMAKKEVPNLLSATTLATSFVIDLPQLWNNSANKVFDALAAGRPVAINHQGWQADFLQSSGAGIVIPANDAEQAAWAMDEFLRDKEKYNLARQAAAHAADTVFNRDLLTGRLVALLEETVRGDK